MKDTHKSIKDTHKCREILSDDLRLSGDREKNDLKETLGYWMASLSLAAGFILLFMGFAFPPEGEIHSSVIYTFGEILVFVGSLMGISIHYRNRKTNNRRIDEKD